MSSPGNVYRGRKARFEAEAAVARQRADRTSNLRLVAFVGALLCGVLAIRFAVVGLGTVVLLVAFAVLVVRHARFRRRWRRASLLASVNDESLRRLDRDWAGLPLRHQPPVDSAHPYAADLHVYGRASLLHLLDTTTSPMGVATLAGWLGAPATLEAVRERQAAVAELAPLVELREELQVLGRLRDEAPDPEPFLRWAEGEPFLARRRLLLWCCRLSPALLWASLTAWALHLLPVPVFPVFVLANAALWAVLGAGTERELAMVRSHKEAFEAYAGQLELLADTAPSAPLLVRLRESIAVEGVFGHRLMRRLDTLVGWAIPPGMGALQYVAAQAAFLWNIHALGGLERWRRQAGPHARTWLTSLGELEALGALAGLAHANPSWAFPTLDAGADRLSASAAGHPLIEPGRRVDNDVNVGPAGTFLLVTGSNMSGKSTLLRTLGANVVLAGAGAPVCARSLRLPPLAVWTSMHVEDSLEEGVSYFLAEVQRLKKVVDAARAAAEGGPPVLYLLDEVLRGTNTDERRVAAAGVLRVLARQHAIGVVSTHDLTIAAVPDLAAIAGMVHFRETLSAGDEGPAMTFDYRLREGLATSTNALLLLELMGLSLDGDA